LRAVSSLIRKYVLDYADSIRTDYYCCNRSPSNADELGTQGLPAITFAYQN